MAFTLRLTDEETAALRRQAELEGRTMADVARQAIREYVDRQEHRARVAESIHRAVDRNDAILEALADR